MADSTPDIQDVAIDLAMGTEHLPGREVLDRDALRSLNVRSDLKGLVHFAAHLVVILMAGVMVVALTRYGGARFCHRHLVCPDA